MDGLTASHAWEVGTFLSIMCCANLEGKQTTMPVMNEMCAVGLVVVGEEVKAESFAVQISNVVFIFHSFFF